MFNKRLGACSPRGQRYAMPKPETPLPMGPEANVGKGWRITYLEACQAHSCVVSAASVSKPLSSAAAPARRETHSKPPSSSSAPSPAHPNARSDPSSSFYIRRCRTKIQRSDFNWSYKGWPLDIGELVDINEISGKRWLIDIRANGVLHVGF